MIEKIKELLRSTNADDIILGVILMEKEGLTDEIISQVRMDCYSRNYQIDKKEFHTRGVIILNNKLFWLWEGIAIARPKCYHLWKPREILYTDGSIILKN